MTRPKPELTDEEIIRRYKNGDIIKNILKDAKISNKYFYNCLDRNKIKRTRNDIVNLPLSVCEDYKNGETLISIGNRHNISYHRVKVFLKRNGIHLLSSNIHPIRLSTSQIEEIVNRYKSGESMNSISKSFKTHQMSIGYHLRKLNIAIRQSNVPYEIPPKSIEDYKNGKSANRIADELNTSVKTVTKCLQRHGIDVSNRKYKAWNSISDDIHNNIIELYVNEKLSGKSIADKLGITDTTVYTILEKYSIPRRKTIFDSNKEKVIEMYNSGKGYNEISKVIGANPKSVLRALKRFGIKTPNLSESKRLPFDEHFFDVIDSEEKAYWLGMMGSDGYIASDDKFGIGLGGESNPEDWKHLLKFINSLKSCHTISYDGIKGRISIKSEYVTNTLKKYGFNSDKSHVFDPRIDLIPKSLHKDFWRGMVDGDGWLDQDTRYGAWEVGLCGTYEACEKYSIFIKEFINTRAGVRPRGSIFCFTIGGRFLVRHVADLLYKDATIYLDRKFNLYNKLVSDCPREFKPLDKKCSKCNSKHLARGLCRFHYNEEYKLNSNEWRKEVRVYKRWRTYLDKN